MKQEETIDFHFRSIWQRIANLYNKEAGKYGGTMSIGFILLNIEKEGTPSTSLGPRMGMKPTSLARSLKTLEDSKLIKRKTDKIDKRKVYVFLTAEGKRMRDRSKDAVLKMNKMLTKDIGPKKLNVFFEVLNELNSKLSNIEDLTIKE